MFLPAKIQLFLQIKHYETCFFVLFIIKITKMKDFLKFFCEMLVYLQKNTYLCRLKIKIVEIFIKKTI